MPLTNEGGAHSPLPSSWRNNLFDVYMWCKMLSITLNIMYMITTFENIYDAASNIAAHQEKTETYAVPIQHGFQILMGCLMMFCLVVDLVILTTSKISIADWYWRPGIFFFTFTCGNEVIVIADMLFSNEAYQQNCLQRLSGTHTTIAMVAEICSMQNRLNHILVLSALLRDTVICGAYVAASYFYMIRLIRVLRSRASSDTAMQIMSTNYHYPITQ